MTVDKSFLLTFEEYEVKAQSTMNFDLTTLQNLDNAALGLAGEAGEFADIVKKHLYHGHALDVGKLKKELGDILWYVMQGCYALGFTMQEVALANNDKLAKRYPNKFNSQDSINRKDD